MNWSHFRSAGRALGTIGLASVLTLATASLLHAQSPTPEGTVITNTATVSFTDANGNVTRNTYDASGNLVSYFTSRNATLVRTCDTPGNLKITSCKKRS